MISSLITGSSVSARHVFTCAIAQRTCVGEEEKVRGPPRPPLHRRACPEEPRARGICSSGTKKQQAGHKRSGVVAWKVDAWPLSAVRCRAVAASMAPAPFQPFCVACCRPLLRASVLASVGEGTERGSGDPILREAAGQVKTA